MRASITHDRSGNIIGITISDNPDAPPATVAMTPGYMTSEVDLSDDLLDVSRLESEEEFADALRDLRIELRHDVRLFRRSEKRA